MEKQQVLEKEHIGDMFDNISEHYDFLNHFLSFGIDKVWRRKVRKLASNYNTSNILDIATGTGDLAIELSKLNPEKITGIDISEKMLSIAKKKTANLNSNIEFLYSSGEKTPFSGNSFDLITIAFGIRNFVNPLSGLKEAKRLLKNDGVLIILEFSKPRSVIIRKMFNVYFFKILPFLANLFAKNKTAYHYLPASVKEFPDGEKFIELMKKAGFENCNEKRLTFGICSIYVASTK